MKKSLLSLLVIAVIGGGVYGATGAFFSDTEVSSGNTITAGSVTLGIANISHLGNSLSGFSYNPSGVNFSFSDLKPLDKGKVTYDVTNGTNQAYLCAMVEQTGSSENSLTDPEVALADNSNTGELGSFLSFKLGSLTGTLANISGVWQSLGVVNASASASSEINYCFGQFDGSGNCLLASGNDNFAQTDSLVASVSFYAEQTRNNPNFSCESLNASIGTSDLFVTNDRAAAYGSKKWFFYNDTNDTIMSINQFAADGGVNDIVVGPGSIQAAKMLLGNHTNPRYNIATYKFNDVKLVDIGSLKYRIYDSTPGTGTPYLHFNIDFNNTDTWQRRLVQVPTGVVASTWTEVDALAGMWTLSGGNWPVGATELGSTPGSTPKTWANILAEYPLAETRSTDSFLGVRVGQPGPVGDEAYVDWIEFDGVKYNFEN